MSEHDERSRLLAKGASDFAIGFLTMIGALLALALVVVAIALAVAAPAPAVEIELAIGAACALALCGGVAIAVARWRSQRMIAPEPLPMTTTCVEITFVRHGKSTNNARMEGGALRKARYVLCNPCVADRDPELAPVGVTVSREAGKRLRAEGVGRYDLLLSSTMTRAMETAHHMFLENNLATRCQVAPFISESPTHTVGIPRQSNIPRPRAEQVAFLRAKHGPRLRLAWDLVDGPRGDNAGCSPPSMARFLRWLWLNPRVQALVEARQREGQLVRIAVISHGSFLSHGVPLDHHPKNNALATARLQVSSEQRDADGRLLDDPELRLGLAHVTMPRVPGWERADRVA